MLFSGRELGAAFRRYVLLPAYWRYVKRSHVLNRYRELQEQQWNFLEENQAIQAGKLYKLLKYSSENILYYKKVVQERGIKIREDRVFDDLKNFPFLTKKIIHEHFDEFYKFRDKTYYLNHSGGSTGEPVEFYQDREYGSWSHAVKLLFNEWAGANIGDRIVKLWGSERDILQGGRGLKRFLSEHLYGIVLLNSFRMTEEDMYRYVQRINHLKPRLILSYVSSIKELARFIKRDHLTVYSPHALMTTAGVLYDEIKEEIKGVFGAPVFNRYGSREVGDMACDCSEHQGLHLLPQIHYLELIDEKGNTIKEAQVPGEIAITALTNYTMPLIRYRIGDRAKWGGENCSCGRGLPMLDTVKGRTASIFRTPDGMAIDGTALTTTFYHFASISKYQVVQEQIDTLEIRIVINPGVTKEDAISDMKQISQKLKSIFGSEMKFKLHFVDDIAPSASGKYHYMISKVEDGQN